MATGPSSPSRKPNGGLIRLNSIADSPDAGEINGGGTTDSNNNKSST